VEPKLIVPQIERRCVTSTHPHPPALRAGPTLSRSAGEGAERGEAGEGALPRSRFGILALAALLCLGGPALADRRPGTPDYEQCLNLVDTAPADAFEFALEWETGRAGGVAARHCAALALVALKQYGDAADRLEHLAEQLAKAHDEMAITVLGQAGNAWMLAGLVERAKFVFDAALKRAPDDADLLVDRARALGENGEYKAALADLDHALQLQPTRDDARVYRAAAHRKLGDANAAAADLAQVLGRAPDNVDALLERGSLRRAAGDAAGARADWLKVATLAPDTPAAGAAQALLEELDVRK
jgi:tetratricopeptide (TPR) repeat protein